MRRALKIMAASVLLAAPLAACGDDEDEEATATTAAAAATPTTEAAGDTTAAPAGEGEGTGTITFRALDAAGPATVQALADGDIDVAAMFTSQGVIAERGWVVLEDDKGLQPAQNLVPVVRQEALTPELEEVLDGISAALTTEDLSEMNKLVDVDKEDPDQVASDFVEEQGLAEGVTGLTGNISVSSANFTEAVIVAHLYADVLEAGGMTVDRSKVNLGSREVLYPALSSGEIDFIVDYTGGALNYLGGTPTADLDETVTALREAASGEGLTVLEPSPADDKDTLVVTQETAERLGLETMSDLAAVDEDLVLGGPPECPERATCLAGYIETYGLRVDG